MQQLQHIHRAERDVVHKEEMVELAAGYMSRRLAGVERAEDFIAYVREYLDAVAGSFDRRVLVRREHYPMRDAEDGK